MEEGLSGFSLTRAIVLADKEALFHLMHAAHHVQCLDLFDLTCEVVADGLQNLSVEEVREKFNITNDYTTEEEEQKKAENEWIHEERDPGVYTNLASNITTD